MIPPGRPPRFGTGPLPLPAHRREDHAFRTGILVSAVVHLVAVALYPLVFGGPASSVPSAAPDYRQPILEGMEIVEIVELPPPPDSPEATAIVVPTFTPSLPGQEVEMTVTLGEPATGAGDDTAELTVAERLRPRMIDPRLWVPLAPAYTELTDAERAQLLLEGMIRSWNDSMAVAEALSARAMDWSYTDDEGRRWGLSPGRLHLGDFSIPIPFNLALPPGRWEALRDRALIRDDLARGAATAVIRETWAERARAIRERLEAERAVASEAAEDAEREGAGDAATAQEGDRTGRAGGVEPGSGGGASAPE